MKATEVYITVNGEKKCVGVLEGETFFRTVSRKKHLYREMNAWSIDAKVFREFIIPRATKVVIFDKDEKVTYSTTVENFVKHGEYLHFKPHRLQIFLKLKYFENDIKHIEPGD